MDGQDQANTVKDLDSVFRAGSAKPVKIAYEVLKSVTKNFILEIGFGGFGVVYLGKLQAGMVAVKMLKKQNDLSDKKFLDEVSCLNRLKHKNIVRFLGYCADSHGMVEDRGKNDYIIVEAQQRLLCFEYAPNGNLQQYLSDINHECEWYTRYQIIKAVCEGVQYLHREHIYHLDLKPENVLLGARMEPKITDFGLSRNTDGRNSTMVTKNQFGTLGYMAPELIYQGQISAKTDIFSLGRVIINLLLGSNGSTENWHETLHEDCPLMKRCTEIAKCCENSDPKKRPSIDYIVDQLNQTETMSQMIPTIIYEPINDRESSRYKILEKFEKLSTQTSLSLSRDSPSASRGCIAASATYRPLFPWDVFSCSVPPSSSKDEVRLTDGVSYNYNCRPIPRVALLEIIARIPELASECGATAEDVDEGRATGLVFISERHNGLETLHAALRFKDKVKVVSLADIYGTDTFGGVRMEDSGCFGTSFGDNADPSLIYVSTKKMVEMRRTPWTVVYRTNLRTGKTKQLTPDGQCDLSPAVSPSGTRVAVAAFRSGRWTGETEHLKTDIFVMNVDRYADGGGLDRKCIIQDGGWPSWGSDNVIFFHRGIGETEPRDNRVRTTWGVFRYDLTTNTTERVTPVEINAVTPAAISETKVAVATIPRIHGSIYLYLPRGEEEYRHIEIFDFAMSDKPSVKITQNINPRADYYSPFVLDGGRRIGYHRSRYDKIIKEHGNMDIMPRTFHKMQSPLNNVGLFRAWGAVHSISTDGSKLAFINNEFRAVWVVDKQGMRIIWQGRSPSRIFSIAWNQNPSKDILYVCVGVPFSSHDPVNIYAITNISGGGARSLLRRLTNDDNNAFPSSNPEGTKIVFRSTRDHKNHNLQHKNLYIMEDASDRSSEITRLTNGDWTDTHCQWSPRGNWIVFSSSRGKPAGMSISENDDPGFPYFSIYLVMAAAPHVTVRVVTGWDPDVYADQLPGHVNHPVFSPDGRSIAFTSDLAAVSVELVSLPMLLHAGRPYGDIFSVDIDPKNINKNKDIDKINRVTHSRYEYCTQAWARFVPDDPNTQWNTRVTMDDATANYRPACPYVQPNGGESWHTTGRLMFIGSSC